jgi:two-component system chemotaxis response regulator CheB
VLFQSAATMFGARVLACVLTGMGQDGLRGCERLRAAGAEIVVQDQPTSVVWGMPGAIATAGLADRVLPLPAIAADLTEALWRARDDAPPSAHLGAGAGASS